MSAISTLSASSAGHQQPTGRPTREASDAAEEAFGAMMSAALGVMPQPVDQQPSAHHEDATSPATAQATSATSARAASSADDTESAHNADPATAPSSASTTPPTSDDSVDTAAATPTSSKPASVTAATSSPTAATPAVAPGPVPSPVATTLSGPATAGAPPTATPGPATGPAATRAAGVAQLPTTATAATTQTAPVPTPASASADLAAVANALAASASHQDAGNDASHSDGGSSKDGAKEKAAVTDLSAPTASPADTHDSSIALVAASTAVTTTPTTSSQPTPATTTTTPTSVLPQEQLVTVLAPLRTASDGSYSISLQLHPADLGEITLHVQVHDGEMSVRLESAQAQTRDTLNAAIGDLRAALEVSGITAGDIDVGSQSAQQSPQQQSQQQGANSGQQQPGLSTTAGGTDAGADGRRSFQDQLATPNDPYPVVLPPVAGRDGRPVGTARAAATSTADTLDVLM